MIENTVSTNGSTAPGIKAESKDDLWKKVAALRSALPADTQENPRALAIKEVTEPEFAEPTATETVAELTDGVAGQHQAAMVDSIGDTAGIGAASADMVCVLPKDLISQDQANGGAPPRKFKPHATSLLATSAKPANRQPSNVFTLDSAKPVDMLGFPNQSRTPSSQILPTIANFQHLLRSYNIEVQYNVIKKKLEVYIAGHTGSFDNHDNVVLTQINSIAALNGFPTSKIPELMVAVGDRKQFNPVAVWIMSRPWDGVDRLPAFYATLVQAVEFPQSLKETLMYRWAVSAVAAALKESGFHGRGVLTLQGIQGLGKTGWVASLVSDEVLRALVVLLNHHLDGSNKDSITRAVSHWLVEIGELDSSFKKDIARLKGFITADMDKVRRPYGRLDSEYPRRTVFCATVNDSNFLVDSTGNSRWWTIPVIQIDYQHGIDMQQLFAQLAVDFESGAQWWLTPEEELILEQHNKAHRVVSAIRERILNAVDMEDTSGTRLPPMTSIQVLRAIGINFPTNPQCKECAGILRELFGESKKINGDVSWRVPLRNRQAPSMQSAPIVDDEDLY